MQASDASSFGTNSCTAGHRPNFSTCVSSSTATSGWALLHEQGSERHGVAETGPNDKTEFGIRKYYVSIMKTSGTRPSSILSRSMKVHQFRQFRVVGANQLGELSPMAPMEVYGCAKLWQRAGAEVRNFGVWRLGPQPAERGVFGHNEGVACGAREIVTNPAQPMAPAVPRAP